MAWPEELDALVRTRGAALVGYATLLCGDRAEAEDLVQDALVKTFARSRAGLRAENLEGYLRRAVLTTYLDRYRRRRRWLGLRHLVAAPEAADGPAAGAGDRADVAAALRGLTPRERACVVLRFYEDLPVAEIADVLGLSPGAVKRYLSDGVHRLEGALGELPATRAALADDAGGIPVSTRRSR